MANSNEKNNQANIVEPVIRGGSALNNISTIVRRELKAYFSAPIAYIFITLFALITGIKFILLFFIDGQATMRNFFDWLPIMLLVFIPPVTMRLWAEERKHGTIEFLLTLPMKTWHIMMGKYIASMIFYMVSLLCSLPIPIMLYFLGEPDWGQILTGYFGALMLGGFYLALGLFISAFFLDQIIAYIVILSSLAMLSFAGWAFVPILLDGTFSGLGEFALKYVGVTGHLESLNRGIIDLKDIVYFISYTAVFLFLNSFFVNSLKFDKKYFMKGFILMVALLFGISFMINLIFADNIQLGRFDLTQNKIFTVSPSTGKVFKELKYPVTISYYVTPGEKMPVQLKNLEREVRDKLEEFKRISKGKLVFKVFYPDPNSATAEKLAKRKIVPQQVQTLASDEIALKMVYSTLVISYLNQKDEVIKLFDYNMLGDLEYIMASRIYRMTFSVDDTDYENKDLFTLNRAPEYIYSDMKEGDVKLLYLVSDPTILKGKLPDKFVGIKDKVSEKLKELMTASDRKISYRLVTGSDKEYARYAQVLVAKGSFAVNDMIMDDKKLTLDEAEEKKNGKSDAKKSDEVFISGIYITYRDKDDASISTVSLENVDDLIVNINKKLSKLIKRTRPKVALYAPRKNPTQQEMMMAQVYRRPPPQPRDDFQRIEKLLSSGNYEVVRVDFTEKQPLPEDVKTVMIIRPENLNQRQLYEIDRLMHEGKNFIFAVENQQLDISKGSVGKIKVVCKKIDPGIKDLFKKFGVTVEEEVVLDENAEILTVYAEEKVEVFGMQGVQRRPVPIDHPAHVKVLSENIDRKYAVTNRVDTMLYYGGSPLTVDLELFKKNNLKYSKLFSSSKKSWSVKSKAGEISTVVPADNEFHPNQALGIMLSGKFPSLYAGKPVPAWPDPPPQPNQPPPPPKQKKDEKNSIVGDTKKSTIIVLGCAEMFNNSFVNAPQHRRLLTNMIDILTLDENLVNIRSKTYEPRKLKAVSGKQIMLWKFIVIGLCPLLFIIIGIIVIMRGHFSSLRKDEYVTGGEIL